MLHSSAQPDEAHASFPYQPTQALHRHCPTTEIPGARDLSGQISLHEQRMANPIPILKPSLSPTGLQFWDGRWPLAAGGYSRRRRRKRKVGGAFFVRHNPNVRTFNVQHPANPLAHFYAALVLCMRNRFCKVYVTIPKVWRSTGLVKGHRELVCSRPSGYLQSHCLSRFNLTRRYHPTTSPPPSPRHSLMFSMPRRYSGFVMEVDLQSFCRYGKQ